MASIELYPLKGTLLCYFYYPEHSFFFSPLHLANFYIHIEFSLSVVSSRKPSMDPRSYWTLNTAESTGKILTRVCTNCSHGYWAKQIQLLIHGVPPRPPVADFDSLWGSPKCQGCVGNHVPFFLLRRELTFRSVGKPTESRKGFYFLKSGFLRCQENEKASFSLCKVRLTLCTDLAEDSWLLCFHLSPSPQVLGWIPLVHLIWFSLHEA